MYFTSLYVADAQYVYAIGPALVARCNLSDGKCTQLGTGTAVNLTAIGGGDADNVYVTGDDTMNQVLLRCDKTSPNCTTISSAVSRL